MSEVYLNCHTEERSDVSISAILFILLFPFSSHATCTPTPDCASIGYTETSCETISLKCPFDQTKLYCFPCDSSYQYTCSNPNEYGDGESCKGKYKSCCITDCIIGAIYYSDSSCDTCLNSNKTPIGIVVKDYELIMSNKTENIQWGGFDSDISILTNYNNIADAKTDFNGKANTAKIVGHFGEDVDTTLHAGLFCHKYSTAGTNAGDWYLPATGELYSYVYNNYNKLSHTWNLAWNISLSNSFWSSSEYSNKFAWYVYSGNGYTNTLPKTDTHSVTCFLAL